MSENADGNNMLLRDAEAMRAVRTLQERGYTGEDAARAMVALVPCGERYRDTGMTCCRIHGHEGEHADCIGGDGHECVDPTHAEDMGHG